MALNDLRHISLHSVRGGHTGKRSAAGGAERSYASTVDKFGRRSVVLFLISLLAILLGAVFTIFLIKNAIV